MLTEKDWIKSVCVNKNDDFLYIVTLSGYRAPSYDTASPGSFLMANADDEEVGRTLLSSIDRSRFFSLEEAKIAWEQNGNIYENWIKNTMKSAMFKAMSYCYIRKERDGFLFIPYHHRALTAWENNNETEANKFTIPLTATAAEMGAALRRCLALCTSKFDPPKDA
jgi:hypothetical protein